MTPAALARIIARFVATCPLCGRVIPADQVMCADCARK